MNVIFQRDVGSAGPAFGFGAITLLGGIVLAACAALALGDWQTQTTHSGVSIPRTAPAERTAPGVLALTGLRDTAEIVYYIAGSPEQADYAHLLEEHGQWTRLDANVPESRREVRIRLVTSEEEQAAVLEEIAHTSHIIAQGPDDPRKLLYVTDLRPPPLAPMPYTAP